MGVIVHFRSARRRGLVVHPQAVRNVGHPVVVAVAPVRHRLPFPAPRWMAFGPAHPYRLLRSTPPRPAHEAWRDQRERDVDGAASATCWRSSIGSPRRRRPQASRTTPLERAPAPRSDAGTRPFLSDHRAVQMWVISRWSATWWMVAVSAWTKAGGRPPARPRRLRVAIWSASCGMTARTLRWSRWSRIARDEFALPARTVPGRTRGRPRRRGRGSWP